jgi:hypothetical protein
MTEQIRLLSCLQCKTLEELPDYEGHPDGDVLLADTIERHHTDRATGTKHIGNLIKIPKAAWDVKSEREQILDQIREALNGGETGLGRSFYALKNNYQDDAMKCFKQHSRNPQCGDYMSKSKQLGAAEDVKEAWSDAGKKRPKDFGPKQFLCQFCPVHSMAVSALREKKGLYK